MRIIDKVGSRMTSSWQSVSELSTISRMTSLALLMMVFVWGLECTALETQDPRSWRGNSSVSQVRRNLRSNNSGSPNGCDVPSPPRFLDTYRPNLINLPYGGGPLMVQEIKVYIIYYGTTFTAHDKEVVRTLLASLTPETKPTETPSVAAWWKIVNEYTEGPHGPHAGPKVSYGGETIDDYSLGKTLNFSNPDLITDIIAPFIRPPPGNDSTALNASAPLPWDPNGMYMVLTAPDVEPLEPVGFCAFHKYSCFDDNCDFVVIHAFAAYPAPGSSFYDSCNVAHLYPELYNPPPNSQDGALDSMVKTLTHELAEAATDPDIQSGWTYPDVTENGDLCNFFLGAGGYFYCGSGVVDRELPGIHAPPNISCQYLGEPLTSKHDGVKYNLHGVNGSRFALQYMWSLTTKSCQLQARKLCSKDTVLTKRKGTIENSLFVDGVGMQTYAPGLNCKWTVDVANATQLVFYLKNLATVGGLDYLTISSADGKVTYLSMSGVTVHDGYHETIAETHILGSTAVVQFHSDDKLAPYPAATGFRLDYLAVFS